MADFSSLSDSDDEKAAQELLSQAMDQTVLEQVAKINCSGFSDSVLPTHLETRFQKLKSFPCAESKLKCSSIHRHSASSSTFKNSIKDRFELKSLSDEDDGKIRSHSKIIADGEKGLEENLESEFHSSPERKKVLSFDKAPDGSKLGNLKFSDGKMRLEAKSPSGSSSNSWDSRSEPVSPPARSGCFWCSPNKVARKKSKENRVTKTSFDLGKNDEVLLDFSAKNQQKVLKKAMKEEEKISREAEKIVNWAKQASARMDISDIEDELSDLESFK